MYSTPQGLQFELMKHASFNGFQGELVVRDLESNPELWKGAVMDRAGFNSTGEKYKAVINLIKLRDLPEYWNVDTLFITPQKGKEDELEALARTWNADEVAWIGGEEANSDLGSHSKELRENPRQILRVWWD